jgi:arylsulfatase A-like enzyme
MRRRRGFSLAVIPLFLLLVGCGREKSPNVVLITLDTLRADFLGCYGSTWVETPNLDAFAAGGARFEQATCQIPATLTSHTCILSSLYPRTSGVRFGSFLVPDEVTTLPEVLREKGYQTAAFVSAIVLEKKYNLDQGFDLYDDGPLNPVERPAAEVNEKVFDWLEAGRDPEKPVFLWAHYYDAHSPYEPPSPWDKKYDPDYDGPLTGASSKITQLIAARGVGASPRDLEHLHALYAGEVSALDEKVGALLDRLSQTLGAENTIIAILADHGESLGERGKFFHGEDLFEPAMRIPFLVSWPGKIEAGKTLGGLVHTLDLAPTLLGLIGIPPLAEAEGDDLSGQLLGESTQEPRNLVAFLETEEPYLSEGTKSSAPGQTSTNSFTIAPIVHPRCMVESSTAV